ncbi:cytochrome c oxidase polypeptide vib [Blastocladiella britannica]|nr:cytochrome c oxidase polypeptide vib [Blastocladiella britannica]
MSDIKVETVAFDARFPNGNQTKHCWQNYVDYFKCVEAKGEDYAPCTQFRKAYMSLCPPQWLEKWDEAREGGVSPHFHRVVPTKH